MTKLDKLVEAFLGTPGYYKTKEGKVARFDMVNPKGNALGGAAGGVGAATGWALGGGLSKSMKFANAIRHPETLAIGAAGTLGGAIGGYFGAKASNKKMRERALPNLKKLGAVPISKEEYKAGKKAGMKMGYGEKLRVFNKRPENFKG